MKRTPAFQKKKKIFSNVNRGNSVGGAAALKFQIVQADIQMNFKKVYVNDWVYFGEIIRYL